MRPWVAIGALLLSGCYDSSFGERHEETTPPPATTTIGELRARFEGTTVAVETETTVCGRVTTCDRSANFYRTLCIESDGAGLEIMAGLDHLHNDYPEGAGRKPRSVAGRPPALGIGRLPDRLHRFAPGPRPHDYPPRHPAAALCTDRSDHRRTDACPMRHAGAHRTRAICPRRAGGRYLGRKQTLHRPGGRRRLHLCPPLRRFRRERSSGRALLADGDSPTRRRPLSAQTAR